MKKMERPFMKISLIIGSLLALLPNLGYAQRLFSPVVNIGTDGAYPPFTYINDRGQLDGFEIALLKRGCQLAELNCRFIYKNVEFSDLLPGVLANRWQIAVGGIGITPDRQLTLDFVKDYVPAKYFLAKKSSPLTHFPEDLSGRLVGVEQNTKFEEYLNYLSSQLVAKGLAPIQILPLPNVTSIEAALISGEIEFNPNGSEVISTILSKAEFGDFARTGPELTSNLGGAIFGVGDGFAFAKGNRLQYLFGKALQEMFYDCSYARIQRRYMKSENALTPAHCAKRTKE